jgi:hypothetical protein
MRPLKCAKPAAASEAVNGLRDSPLASGGNPSKKPEQAQPVTSRRLIGARYSNAAPQTAIAAALLEALKRRAGRP